MADKFSIFEIRYSCNEPGLPHLKAATASMLETAKQARRRARLQGLLAAWFLLLEAATAFLATTSVRINLTDSLPRGFYRITPGGIERGTLVSACPDLSNPAIQTAHERGYLKTGWFPCNGGAAPLLKYVLALPGDSVEVAQEGIRVNGQPIENSIRLASDSAGRPLPPLPASREAPPGHVWLFSGHALASFDSRYFGPAKISDIIGVATPLLVSQ